MREFQRTDRLGSELRRELAVILRDEVKDPRLGQVTVQEVRITRDLAHAKVYFTCAEADAKATEQLLNKHLAGFLRHELAQRVRARGMPQLHFQYDASVLAGERMSALIDQAVADVGPSEE
jgi:ribosome-binding factor A